MFQTEIQKEFRDKRASKGFAITVERQLSGTKEVNPPNCPELRPIERYWALVKKHPKITKGSPENENDFGKKWIGFTKKWGKVQLKP